MLTTNLRKVGGSVMLAVPPAVLESLSMESRMTVCLAIMDGALLIKPVARPKYALNELLSQCDSNAAVSEDDKEWTNGPSMGNELI